MSLAAPRWALAALAAGAMPLAALATPAGPPPVRQVRVEPLDRLDARTGALLIAGGGRGDVDGAALLELLPGSREGLRTLRLVVEVDGGELLEGSPEGRVPVAAAVYVLDDGGTLKGYLSRGIVLEPGSRAAVGEVGLRWVDRVDVPAGRCSVRIVLRNHRTGAVFLDRLDVVVPAPAAPRSGLMPPRIAAAAGGWVDARVTTGPPPADDAAGRLPAARPVIVNRQATALQLLAPGAAGVAALRARLVDPAGRTVAEPGLRSSDDVADAAVYAPARLDPVDVPPGLYRLVVATPGEGGDRERLASVGVVVTDGQAGLPWPAVDLTPPGEPASQAGDPPGSARIRQAYRDALVEMARGDVFEASHRLAALERSVAADESARAFDRLIQAQQRVAAGLGSSDPAALRPVLWLHRTMSRYYRVRRESILGTHAWRMVEEIATMLARSGDPADRRFATDLLTDQATELVEVPAMKTATEMLRRVLELEPDHVDALMAMGASFERQGEGHAAVASFRRVAELDPARREAVLRMAVNLERIGRDGRAREAYESLLAADGPAWVRTVAVQQLALQLLDDGATGRAVELLEAAIGEGDPNPRLRILLAFAWNAAGQPRRTTEVLSDLEVTTGDATSPRFRYAEWPRLGPGVDHRELETRAREGLPALRAALDVPAAAETPS